MAARKLERVVNKEVAQRLSAAGVVTCKDFFELSEIQLMLVCELSYAEARSLVAEVSRSIVKRAYTAYELLQQYSPESRRISSGSLQLDAALGGGLLVGTIVEVCGPPGVGKSQMCLSACASVLLQKHNQRDAPKPYGAVDVIYLDTELKFSSDRLLEILQTRCGHLSEVALRSMMERVNVKRILSVRDLYSSIDGLESEVISSEASLVIIDSIAALVRKEGLNDADKQLFIMKQSALLKKFAEQCSCTILATNQIMIATSTDEKLETSNSINRSTIDEIQGFKCETGENFPSAMMNTEGVLQVGETAAASFEVLLRPALGLGWYHCVTTRILMSISTAPELRADSEDAVQFGSTRLSRLFTIEKSPMCPQQKICFCIGSSGIEQG